MSNQGDAVETIELPHGIGYDLDEAWRKLTTRQFGGDAGRAFPELIQNAIDAYPADTPWKDRLFKVQTGEHSISITDYGEGMGRDRLRLLATLGGTDKHDDPSKIGKFGLGFFAIFSPKLQTRLVQVSTRCESESVELTFTVHDPQKLPQVSHRILGKPLDFSTRIEVEFADRSSPITCLEHAKRYLRYYPCRALINGQPCMTEWQAARDAGARFFAEGACDGFMRRNNWHGGVHLLCKYEHILFSSVENFITGGHGCTYDLRDYRRRQVPYIPGVEATLNCSNLSVTISRDGYYLDWAWEHAVRSLAQALIHEIGNMLDGDVDPQLVIANQYVLQDLLKPHIQNAENNGPDPIGDGVDAEIRKLAAAEVYRLNGHRGRYSIKAIAAMRSADVPLFFAPRQANLRWLGGDFRHDFIVLPPSCSVFSGAPGLYDDLFRTLFEDVVNLDTIRDNPARIAQLVERNIVDRRALTPTCKIAGTCSLREEEARLLHEIDILLARPGVSKAIASELHMPVGRIRSVFFDVDVQGITIATGLFGHDDRPLDDGAGSEQPAPRNLADGDEAASPSSDIRLGLLRSHPFIRHLIGTGDPYRSYYALTFVSGELACCQRRLVPYSPFFHFVKERLAAAMRRALLDETVPPSGHEPSP